MKSRSSLTKGDAEQRRTVDSELNSKKSVRWSLSGEKDVFRPISTGYSILGVCLGVGLSVILTLENILDLGLAYPLERASRVLVPGFCFGFLCYCLAKYFEVKLKRWSLFTVVASVGLASEILCVVMSEVFPSWILNFFVFLPIAVVCSSFFSETVNIVMAFGMVISLRFLAWTVFFSVPGPWRQFLGNTFAVLGVLAASGMGKRIATKGTKNKSKSENYADAAKSSNDVKTSIVNSASASYPYNLIPNRRSSLPILHKTQGNSLNPQVLKKAEFTLNELLSEPDLPPEILSRLQTLSDLFQAPDSPVILRRSKSIPLVTLYGGSIFSQQVADLPYTITEQSNHSPQRFRRHFSGQCRLSDAWTQSLFVPNLETNHFAYSERLSAEEKRLSQSSPATVGSAGNSPQVLDDDGDENEERLGRFLSVVDTDRDRFSSKEAPSRKTSNSSHRSSARVSFPADLTILNSTLEEETQSSEVSDVPVPESDALRNLLEMEQFNQWNYPIFDLAREAPDNMLSKVAYRIFTELDLMEAFQIPTKEFVGYFQELERGYRDNPYHNRIHATDVLHAVYYMTTQRIYGLTQIIPADDYSCKQSELRTSSLLSKISDNGSSGILGANFLPLELMAILTAAAMHDYDHPGRTNAFLIASCHPLAVLYNNRSVLENHHAAASWSLLISDPRYAWLANLSDGEFKRFRYLVIDEILVTDLVQHFTFLAEFSTKVNEEVGSGINWMVESDRLLVSKMVLKMADISGPCKSWQLHLKWTDRIADEFYLQGEEERQMQLSVSPYMDRNHPQLAKLQESFITHLVAPLCNCLGDAGLLPSYLPENDNAEDEEDEEHTGEVVCLMTKNLQENHANWVILLNAESTAAETSN